MDFRLSRAILAIREGDHSAAKSLLRSLLREQPENELAWLWLAVIADTDEARLKCYEQVVLVNPLNNTAQRGLKLVQARLSKENSRRRRRLTSTFYHQIFSYAITIVAVFFVAYFIFFAIVDKSPNQMKYAENGSLQNRILTPVSVKSFLHDMRGQPFSYNQADENNVVAGEVVATSVPSTTPPPRVIELVNHISLVSACAECTNPTGSPIGGGEGY